MSRLDLIIFGATGFTGKHAAAEMVRINQKDKKLYWGVAGRSKAKLEKLVDTLKKNTGEDLSKVKIIEADVNNDGSLKAMTAQAKVIVNCCGPFRFYGEQVVRACIASKTHHVDVSGEPQFIETVQLKYHKAAEEAGIFIVSACGFDSIPNDMGVVFLEKNFKGTLNSVESHMSMNLPAEYNKWFSPVLNYGTWASLVNGLAHWDELQGLRKQLYPEKLPPFKPALKSRSIIHKHGDLWYLPFPGADKSIVYRTQRFLYETTNKRPIQFKPYMGFPNFIAAIATLFMAGILFVMTKTSFTKNLLLKHPRLFSLGMTSKEGPSEEVINNTTFEVLLSGVGWKEGSPLTDKPDKKLVAKVSGVNPGYGATVVALLRSAIAIIMETERIPGRGGVLTSGAAFSRTNLINTLNENGFKFSILKEQSYMN